MFSKLVVQQLFPIVAFKNVCPNIVSRNCFKQCFRNMLSNTKTTNEQHQRQRTNSVFPSDLEMLSFSYSVFYLLKYSKRCRHKDWNNKNKYLQAKQKIVFISSGALIPGLRQQNKAVFQFLVGGFFLYFASRISPTFASFITDKHHSPGLPWCKIHDFKQLFEKFIIKKLF